MKHVFLSLCLAAGLPAVAGESLAIDGGHSAVMLQWNHFGFSNPVARLEKVQGTLDLDQGDMTRSRITVAMPLEGLRSGAAFLDKRLLGSEFFDSAHYPVATFRSVKVERGVGGRLAAGGVGRTYRAWRDPGRWCCRPG